MLTMHNRNMLVKQRRWQINILKQPFGLEIPQASDMDPRVTCPQCQNKLSITGISRMIHCSFTQENFIRITCPQCRSPLSITWISTAIPFLIGQALIRITGDGYLSKEQMISPNITENAAPVASSNGKPSSVFLSPGPFPALQGDASPNLRPYRSFSMAPSFIVRPKQRAVLCGVTYSKTSKYKLKGTVDDVKIMKEFLMRRFQFPEEGIRVLTEEQGNPLFPTKKNIQDSLHWLVRDCQYGDSLVFFFSGHGLRQPDFYDDELDGFDETICPVDFMEQGMILDNEINDIIVRPLTTGVTLHAIVDACYSGTILDLPFLYDNRQAKWVDNSPPSGAYRGTSGGLAISLSTCVDNWIAADTVAFGRKTMNGAMTNSFTRTINENPNITYGQLLITIQREIIKANDCYCLNNLRFARVSSKKLSQEVLLSSSMKFNVSRTKFSFYPVIDISWR